MQLQEFAARVKGATPFSGLILAFDPGETTGFCSLLNYEVLELRQILTPINDVPQSYRNIYQAMQPYYVAYGAKSPRYGNPPVEVACEDYRIYDWKSDDHKWSAVHTIKIVGFVQAVTDQLGFPPAIMRMAQVAKGFCTDDKLRMWELHQKTVGLKHARDALRHAIYHSIFHKKVE